MTTPRTLVQLNTLSTMAQVINLRDAGALFVINHSGGKDSQAMAILVSQLVPASQVMVVHADLGAMEWAGLQQHIVNTMGISPVVVHAVNKAGQAKDLLTEWERKGKAPSAANRWCTSDLKRDPIQKAIRATMKARGLMLAVNCMGLRGEESTERCKGLDKAANKATGVVVTLAVNTRLSKAGRTVMDWLPIHGMTTAEVFATIAAAGQQPHPMYSQGMTRLSCCFCIMASKADLTRAAQLNPELYARYCQLERTTGYTLKQGKSLPEVTGIEPKAIKAA